MPLSGKRILLGVTGGIAAYKTAHLIRLLIKKGAEVKVIMTTSALSFISPLTLATLSKGPVFHDFFNKTTGEWTNHVELGSWADLMVIAPLSANTLAKMTSGQSDNLLLCTYLSCTSPVLVAPAMDLDMYQHPAVNKNLATLRQYGHEVMDAATGELASGLSGQGRMPEPEEILIAIERVFYLSSSPLKGKKMMITAGPTHEVMDPVRYISNHSSGKMGISLAEEAAKRGALVKLILGPTFLMPKHPSIQTIRVSTAVEMFEEAEKSHSQAEIAIFTAAVSDFRPESPSSEKIKKKEEKIRLTLVKNPDIARNLGGKKKRGQVHVGFALESDEGTGSAEEKLKTKNFDFIVLNSLLDPEAGFQKNTNQVTFIDKNGKSQKSPVLKKEKLACIILDKIEAFFPTTEPEETR